MQKIVLETNLEGVKFLRRGKVRDIYEVNDYLLIVATDRVSAFDVVLPNGIPGKGRVLTQISLFWFNQVKDIIENHVVSANVEEFPESLRKYKDILEGRSMLVRKATPLPVECIVRGYITGSGWKDYQKTGMVCGIKLPPELLESQRLPEPIYTPSTKAEQGHDINISFEETVKILGKETAEKIRNFAITIYKKASEIAEKKGIIIADTKMEFGFYNDKIILIDELLTPDSSRFWSMKDYSPGKSQDSYDKQIVRDYLLSIKWDKKPPAPELPEEIVKKTAERYEEIFKILTF
ncbi:Phosphoribosylaminoimidazole-succinocarboxamide synthase [Thermodesulfovibrio sp. N1]|uniref:phosphoribosylaminoimidazolesuccinocarboxamide synthase n=1 Tax=unclassified Thermodesulfovibrio TaxID=2645936 RepID=UPI00083B4D15|nr:MULTISPECIES: phosphoribosylaminoimidazolesuccinocarboxamide synthase [unclassified Thermodesulfovibrio]MDI1472594.1 phosphoribosylaminoimidazolesuccinocarboxamide synthase [Thermodesulfovibrio sp. 1176]ODA44401.1 Phosphoribosylaminoimidazole-succinocarboxamide synthase [Thermodesulfovibrio sp. N1]